MVDVLSGSVRCCPICAKPSISLYRPFCSQMCKHVDLGHWFSESYVIATPLDDFDDSLPLDSDSLPDSSRVS